MSAADGVDASELLERGRELAVIDSALSAARAGDGAIVLLEGPAGIGKTRVVADARKTADRADVGVLYGRGSDLEREFRWGVVRQLLEPALAGRGASERSELLRGSAALAAHVVAHDLDMTGRSASDGEDEGALLHGLYWLCSNLSERGPVLVVVDDAHWCDLASLRFVSYLAGRIEGLRLALLVATRRGESPREDELLARLAGEPGATTLSLGPLGGESVARVLAARLGEQPEASFAEACRAATQGNPFMLEELARALRERGLAPDATAAAAVGGIGPRSVARAIIRRVGSLAPGAVPLARSVAVLGPDASLHHAGELGELSAESAGRAADALVAAEVLTASRPLEFIHPLARSAIYDDLPAGERSRLHRRVARMLAAEAAPAERVAAHLLATEPSGDPWTVEVLRAAAGDAIANAAAPAAIAYLERAVAEPPASDGLAATLHELGHAEAIDGRTPEFEAHLRRAIELTAVPELRAKAALDLIRATAMAGDLSQAGHVCLEALAVLGDDDGPLAAEIESELLTVAINELSFGELAGPRMMRRIEQLQQGRLEDPAILASIGATLTCTLPPASIGAAAVERAAASGLPPVNSMAPGSIGNGLLLAGELDRAGAYYDGVIAEARRRGLRMWTAIATGFRARVSMQLGLVRRAEEEARLGLELYEDTVAQPGRTFTAYLTAHLAEALLERGALEETDRLLDRRGVPNEPATYGDTLVLGMRSRLRLAQGRAEDALADARASGVEPFLNGNPTACTWRSEAALALLALGRRGEAVELADQELALARAFGVPHAISAALRTTARCQDNTERMIAPLKEAIATVEHTSAGLELTRATVELGAVLRRAGKRSAALDTLRSGLDLAHRAGASVLAERAHGDLITAGARPRRLMFSGIDGLTASERRVSEMAAAGMTNRHIAQDLFVTRKTVESHLSRAYRKLDISSREQLAQLLATEVLAPTAA